ncbi:hypothetical protein [Rhizobium wenxiniae]|jgi:hypothetical protein|uniref:hypothetical protein n=1 Tax=Rhizobium wenxiniae TaxID=1737357 RepID=UPI003C22DCA5
MRRAVAIPVIACFALGQPFPAFSLEPIPGSLIYPTQPKTKLKKAPIGSLLTHQFQSDGYSYSETYRIGPNREFQLLSRTKYGGID